MGWWCSVGEVPAEHLGFPRGIPVSKNQSKFRILFVLTCVKSLLLSLTCCTCIFFILLHRFSAGFRLLTCIPGFMLMEFLLPHLNGSHNSPRLFENPCCNEFAYLHWYNLKTTKKKNGRWSIITQSGAFLL